MRSLALALALTACAHASAAEAPVPTPADACATAAEIARAEATLGTCRTTHASDPGWPARGAYDAIVPRLSAHLASLDPPREVTTDEVQPLAEQMWALLDQVHFPDAARATRDRAEDAAERLLRERDVRAAPGAAIEALDAIAQVGAVADPTGGTDPCAPETRLVLELQANRTECR